MSSVPKLPKISDRFSIIPITSNEFRLHSLAYSLSISSQASDLLPRLLQLLDGKHRMTDILLELHSFDEERIVATLVELVEVGILEDADSTKESILADEERARYYDQLTFFSYFAVPQHMRNAIPWPDIPKYDFEYQERLKQAHVVVYGLGRLGSQLVRLLALVGVGRIIGVDDGYVSATEANSDAWFSSQHIGLLRGEAIRDLVATTNKFVEFTSISQKIDSAIEMANILSESTFAILSTDDFNPKQYDIFNLACLQSKIVWTSCRLVGFEFDIGPTVIPFKTPCYKCFDLRQKSNLTDYEEYLILEDYLQANKLRSALLTITPGVGLVALEATKALTHFMEPATYAHLFSLNLLTLASKLHPILKIPRCPHCGRPSQGRPTIHIWQKSQVEDSHL